jgi:hypothetical protein
MEPLSLESFSKELHIYFHPFIKSKSVDLLAEHNSGNYILAVSWEIPAIEIARNPKSFADIFNGYIKPLANLMDVSQSGLIDHLRTEISSLREALELSGSRESKIQNDFDIYKSAIKDCK